MLSIFLLGLLQTQLLEIQAEIPHIEPPKVEILTLSQELATTSRIARQNAVEKYVTQVAYEYKVSPKEMMATLKCENFEFDPNLQSYHKDSKSPNGREQSYGLAQWNVVHNDITVAQAKDPEWSLKEMAKMFSKGKKSMWSCWKIINSPKKE
jgi:hypothetical protein